MSSVGWLGKVGWICGFLASLAACGGDADDGAGDDRGDPIPLASAQALEGVYGVSSFTRNVTGCTEGASVLESLRDHFFVLVPREVLGMQTLELASCPDLAACQALAQQVKSPQSFYSFEYGLTLSAATGDGALTGFLASTGTSSAEKPGMCSKRTYTAHHFETDASGVVHIESRITNLPDAPQEDGACWARPAEDREEASRQPCSSLEVIDAARTASL